MYIEVFNQHFASIQEPRQSAKVIYPLSDILFVTLCACIAGAEGWKDIQEYAEGHLDWFQQHGVLLNGVPVDDTIARIISRIKPEQFQLCFINWIQSLHELSQGELVVLEGKTLRGSYDRDDRCSTLHIVNAYASRNRVVLGQYATDSKSSELTAIPELIRLPDVRGTLVSIDALGCQKSIATDLINEGADYLLAVKGNQPRLEQAVTQAFRSIIAAPLNAERIRTDKGHGRIEARGYWVLPVTALEKDFDTSAWPGMATVGVTQSYRQEKGKAPSLEQRYYISSADLDEERFAEVVRGHWQVESLHWVLDVSMNEDNCQIYRDHGAANWSQLRKMSLNMLRAEPAKASIPTKRKRAWMKTAYLEKVLNAGLNQSNNK